MTTQAERRQTSWEQHFSTIANAVIIGVLVFLGSQFWTTNNTLTEFSVTNKFLAESVNEMRAQIKDMSMNYVTKTELKELEIRVRKMESSK